MSVNTVAIEDPIRIHLAEPEPAPRLLLVDDEADLLDVIARRLRRRGFFVETVPGAREAMVQLASNSFDLILLDHNMPEMSGIELLSLLRQTHSPSELPVIMLTAQCDASHIVRALDLGASDYITKPLDFEVACARIRTQLNRKRAEAALKESEERYQLAGRSTNEGLWDWDLVNNRMYYSDRWKAILGLPEIDLGHSPEAWLDRVHRQDRRQLQEDLEAHWRKETPALRSQHRILHADGSYRWVLCSGLCVHTATGQLARMAGSITDITEDKVKDPLTGLGNRAHFMECLQRAVDASKRDTARWFAVLFLDVDRFKVINDTLGHAAGDALLHLLGRRIEAGTRAMTAARFGGDEFAVLIDNLQSRSDAFDIAIRIQKKLHEPYVLCGRDTCVTVSVGVAFSSPDMGDAESILGDADVALYRAKHAGRSRVEVFDEVVKKELIAHLALENDLRRALANGEISLHYQPQVRLADKHLIGFEALARWITPKRGQVPTQEFIALAEKTRLIIPIGEWILREACRQMRYWHLTMEGFADLRISVNLSALQLQQADLVDAVKSALAESQLLPQYLCLELTESTFFADPESATKTLRRLKEIGVRLELDDFGTGYSSLSCLGQLPIDGLKIDHTFTAKMHSNDTEAVLKSIIDLAARLDLQVVAEGVEYEMQSAYMKGLGCVIGQGFYYAKPMPPDGVRKYLEIR